MDKIEELLTRGVDQIIPSKEELEKVLKSGKKLRIYQGFDPSSPDLHIGHMIGLMKLRQWQKLGHKVIFLIGDFTGMIGDPTGREETRPLLSKETVEKNAKTYKNQAGKILNFEGENSVEIKFNSDWLEKLKTPEVLDLFSKVTYQQIIKRGMFKKRLENDEDVSFNEITYPILQGYDSVAMDVDVEVGGRDQLFNMLIGRDLVHKIKRKNKFVMTTQLLVDSQGNKVGKTTGNAINLTGKPEEIFGAVMNFPDDVIAKCLECLTELPLDKVKSIEKEIKNGENPLRHKKILAFEIVKLLYGESEAKKAQDSFEKVVQQKQTPEFLPTITRASGASVAQAMISNNIVKSMSEAKGLARQDGLSYSQNQEPYTKIEDPKIVPKGNFTLKIGTIGYYNVEEENK